MKLTFPVRRTTAWICLVATGLIVAGAAPEEGQAETSVCEDATGRRPVIEAGRERDVRKLFQPHKLGEALGDKAPGWRSGHAGIQEAEIHVQLVSDAGTAVLALRHRGCADGALVLTPSFALVVLEGAGTPGLDVAVALLGERVTSNDNGRFFRVWADPPPPKAEAPPELPLHRTLAGTAVLLALGLLGLLLGLGDGVRRAPWSDPDWRRAIQLLGWITLAGAILRWLPDPTFLREAYPLAAPGPISRELHWGAPLLSYPQGPFLLVRALSGVLPAHGYDAWFGLNLLLGTLSIPAAFAAGTSLARDRSVGLVAACLLAFWPQHIRFVASESAHVHLIFWALVSVGFTARAARDGGLLSFVAAAGSAAALCLTRPEAALWGPALLLLGLGGQGAILTSLRRWRSALPRAILLVGIIGLLLPQLAVTASDATPLGPTGTGTEALDMDSLVIGLKALFIPTELNAFFDPATSPLWLWPLCWVGVFQLWRQGYRWSASGLAVAVLFYVLLYAKMLPAVSLWALGRYHLAALPAVALLAACGWVFIAGRFQALSGNWARIVGSSAAVGALGCAIWWPAVNAFPFAWQEEQDWLVELSRAEPPVLDGRTRLITPDNRRRFGDLSPREAILGLSGTTRLTAEVITVAHALKGLHIEDEHPPALFYAGLYCGMGVGPDEAINPQCAAMEAAFELEVVVERPITGRPWLLIYQDAPHPERLVLYRVGRRKLSPDAALALLPPALELGQTVPGSEVLGTSPRADTDPPDPPL